MEFLGFSAIKFTNFPHIKTLEAKSSSSKNNKASPGCERVCVYDYYVIIYCLLNNANASVCLLRIASGQFRFAHKKSFVTRRDFLTLHECVFFSLSFVLVLSPSIASYIFYSIGEHTMKRTNSSNEWNFKVEKNKRKKNCQINYHLTICACSWVSIFIIEMVNSMAMYYNVNEDPHIQTEEKNRWKRQKIVVELKIDCLQLVTKNQHSRDI